MKDMFPGYYRPDEKELEKLWSEGTFVFDTNVLLDLYSYPETVRDVFLSVLRKISDKIWVPYQVGIEFHRNRFTRIKQSNQKIERLAQTIQNTGSALATEVNEIELEKRNIGISDIQDRLTAVQEAHKALSEAVKLACNKLPPISLDDKIGAEISVLLEGKVGPPPTDQADLDKLIGDGADRYDKKIPPGFADVQSKGDETFRDRGITYPRKFGDLILWRQLLAHATEKKITAVIFITGDKKKDWWWTDDGKTLGPLPELVQEITLIANVKQFWMYSADQFLEHAETFLKATEVTAEAVEQVKEFAEKNIDLSNLGLSVHLPRFNSIIESHKNSLGFQGGNDRDIGLPSIRGGLLRDLPEDNALSYFPSFNAKDAVERWLKLCEPDGIIFQTKNFPDFIVDHAGYRSGYEIKSVRSINPRAFPPSVVNALLRGYLEVNEGRLDDFSIIFILPEERTDQLLDATWRDEMFHRGESLLSKYPAQSLIIGCINEGTFSPSIMISG